MALPKHRFDPAYPCLIGKFAPGPHRDRRGLLNQRHLPSARLDQTQRVSKCHEDGSPMAGEADRIVLPDGSIREGRLSSNGQPRVDGFDPGTCKIWSPNLDANEWQRV